MVSEVLIDHSFDASTYSGLYKYPLTLGSVVPVPGVFRQSRPLRSPSDYSTVCDDIPNR